MSWSKHGHQSNETEGAQVLNDVVYLLVGIGSFFAEKLLVLADHPASQFRAREIGRTVSLLQAAPRGSSRPFSTRAMRKRVRAPLGRTRGGYEVARGSARSRDDDRSSSAGAVPFRWSQKEPSSSDLSTMALCTESGAWSVPKRLRPNSWIGSAFGFRSGCAYRQRPRRCSANFSPLSRLNH